MRIALSCTLALTIAMPVLAATDDVSRPTGDTVSSSSAPARATTSSTSTPARTTTAGDDAGITTADPSTTAASASSSTDKGKIDEDWKVEEGEKALEQSGTPGGVAASSTAAPGAGTATVTTDRSTTAASASSGTDKGKIDEDWKVEEGENAREQSGTPDGLVAPATDGSARAGADAFLKIGGVKGETTKNQAPGIDPDEIDLRVDDLPVAPDFSILLGGGDSEEAQADRDRAAALLLTTMTERSASAWTPQTLSLGDQEIEMTVLEEVKLFGFIPVQATATVRIDATGTAAVDFPWWTFLASGKDEEDVGSQAVEGLGAALIALRDTLKQAFMVQ